MFFVEVVAVGMVDMVDVCELMHMCSHGTLMMFLSFTSRSSDDATDENTRMLIIETNSLLWSGALTSI